MTRLGTDVTSFSPKAVGEKVEQLATERQDDPDIEAIVVPESSEDVLPQELHFEIRKTQDGKWNWVLWAANRRPLATNPRPYTRRNDAERAVRRMIAEVAESRVLIARL